MWEYVSYSLQVKNTYRFLEIGHTQNEGDCMHAYIEYSKKRKSIYVPMQRFTLVWCSKVNNNPYVVIEIANEEFLDFKQIL